MILPSDYDTARAYDGSGSGNQLPTGGHICRIRNAKVTKARSSGRDMLVVAFDIAENSEWDGYYAERHKRSCDYNPDAKWPGVFRSTVTNAEGRTNGFFKGLIEAIEQSNPGFNFAATGANEGKLVGKYVGFNFGEEEYLKQDTGEIRVSVKPQYAVSVSRVREGIEPPPRKKLDNSAQPSNSSQPASDSFTEDDYDKLPF